MAESKGTTIYYHPNFTGRGQAPALLLAVLSFTRVSEAQIKNTTNRVNFRILVLPSTGFLAPPPYAFHIPFHFAIQCRTASRRTDAVEAPVCPKQDTALLPSQIIISEHDLSSEKLVETTEFIDLQV